MTAKPVNPSQPRRVLITGAGGGIGSAAALHLSRLGMMVTGLSLGRSSGEGCDRFIVGDAASPADVASALTGVDAVVHLAAIPHPSLGTPLEVFSTNVTSTFNVLEQAGLHGIPRVVVASSINASGISFNRHRVMPAYFPLDELLPVDIEDAYSLSKRTAELISQMAARRWNLTVACLRFPLVKDAAVLRAVAETDLADPGRSVREGWSYLDLRDAVRAIHLALIRPLTGSTVIGLSASDTLIRLPTAELLAEFAPGIPVTRSIDGFDSAVDTRVAESLLGFTPHHSIHDPSDRELANALRNH